MYIYIYIERERERERDSGPEKQGGAVSITRWQLIVSFYLRRI